MPYYVWKGVTLAGAISKGALCARSPEDLDTQLFKRDIALLQHQEKKIPVWQRATFDESLKIQFFGQLATLLSSGVFLAEALELVSQQMQGKPRLQEIIITISDKVQQGVSFSNALAMYPDLFDPLTIQMARVGGDTGTLGVTLSLLCEDLEMKRDIKSRVRSALLLPVLTLLFFIMVAVFVVAVILPRFSSIFALYGANLPLATQRLLALSEFMRSWQLPLAVGAVAFIVSGVAAYVRTPHGSYWWNRLVVRMPWIGSVANAYRVAPALRSIALLLGRGMPLVTALQTVRMTTTHPLLHEQCSYLEQEVAAGESLSNAVQRMPSSMFGTELSAAARVGEASGNLAPMLMRVATSHYEQVKRELLRATALVQPFLMIVLGLMIMGLIMAIYMPIFSLSQVVG